METVRDLPVAFAQDRAQALDLLLARSRAAQWRASWTRFQAGAVLTTLANPGTPKPFTARGGVADNADTLATPDEAVASGRRPGAAHGRPQRVSRATGAERPLGYRSRLIEGSRSFRLDSATRSIECRSPQPAWPFRPSWRDHGPEQRGLGLAPVALFLDSFAFGPAPRRSGLPVSGRRLGRARGRWPGRRCRCLSAGAPVSRASRCTRSTRRPIRERDSSVCRRVTTRPWSTGCWGEGRMTGGVAERVGSFLWRSIRSAAWRRWIER
jgi:hypothetical protein